jgi:hypothetical protein
MAGPISVSRRTGGSALLGWAAVALVAHGAFSSARAILLFHYVEQRPAAVGTELALVLELLAATGLTVAFGMAAWGLLHDPESRDGWLRRGALLAAWAFVASAAAAGLLAFVDSANYVSDTYVAARAAIAGGSLLLALAAWEAAKAFSGGGGRGNGTRRSYLLGWASGWLAGASAFYLASGVLVVAFFLDRGAPDSATTAYALAAAGQGIAAIGAAIGSAGLWSYRRHRGLLAASLRRSRNLSISSAVFAAGFGLATAGVTIVAVETTRGGADEKLVAYYWLDIPDVLAIAVAGICASVCFYRSWLSAASETV